MSNIYDYVDQDLFTEAFDLVYHRLDKDLVSRLKARLNSYRRNKLCSCSINDRNRQTTLLAAGVQNRCF